ncbi:hypothetical protein Cenrod_1649 [Candidatus Symbiobacter mobilis CR]|uniref:Uncharacterized protein n=1 Tax=Candidatus Symbiobacter mobilis CR TaxID=946483 RepID=U5NC20_9BURK|nr:hypothetical protein Cenrod_1649 [Candidatus Symbiobacter mobilis CR]
MQIAGLRGLFFRAVCTPTSHQHNTGQKHRVHPHYPGAFAWAAIRITPRQAQAANGFEPKKTSLGGKPPSPPRGKAIKLQAVSAYGAVLARRNPAI